MVRATIRHGCGHNGTPGFTQYGISAFNYGTGSVTVYHGIRFDDKFRRNRHQCFRKSGDVDCCREAEVPSRSSRLGRSIPAPTTTIRAVHLPASRRAYNPKIRRLYRPGVFGDVLVNDSGNIVAAAGDGINAYNYGTGNVAVNLGFGVSIQAMTSANSISGNGNSPFGIGAFNYGHGDIHVTTSSGDSIQSGSSGINASNQYNPSVLDRPLLR